jgi:hypothetical protein
LLRFVADAAVFTLGKPLAGDLFQQIGNGGTVPTGFRFEFGFPAG